MKIAAILSLALLAGTASIPLHAQGTRAALQLVADGLTQPLTYIQLPEGPALVVDQPGYVWLLEPDGTRRPEPVLNLTNRLSDINLGKFDERGLIDLALHPKFPANRRVYVTYTSPRRSSAPEDWDCTLRLSEFTLPAAQPLRIDPAI